MTQSWPHLRRVKSALIPVLLFGSVATGLAKDVPLPPPRPMLLSERPVLNPDPPEAPESEREAEPKSQPKSQAESNPEPPPDPVVASAPSMADPDDLPTVQPGPSLCRVWLAEIARFTPQPDLVGPGECGAVDVVRLEAVTVDGSAPVTVSPPAVLRCEMAMVVADWVREDMAPAASELGEPMTGIVNFDSYQCRGRNGVVGAKLSEHGRGNAIDIRAIKLASGKLLDLSSPAVDKPLRERARASICQRFTTVLGPGSDRYHENHIHLDLAARRNGYRLCQWEVRGPATTAAAVPLPRPKPTAQLEAEAP